MNIALIITCLGMGGAQRQVCDLADEFVKFGHNVLLISMNKDVLVHPRSNDVDVVNLNMKKNPLGFISAYWQVFQCLKEFKPDVVHSHMVHANLFSRLLRLLIHFPKLICTAHSSNEGGKGRMLAYRFTDSLCDLTTNVSQEAVDISIKRRAVPSDHIIAMHNGIDTERFTFNPDSRKMRRVELGLTCDTPLILAVGRLTEAKDYPNLLSAMSQLPECYNNVQLVIIGTGEDKANLLAITDELGLMPRVHFLGLRNDVSDWMSASDIYAMSSAWEGMPLVLLEAMACERVIVATDCGGVKEVLDGNGFLVPPKNSEKLADALTFALSMSPSESLELGLQAKRNIEQKYSLSAVAKKWIELYESENGE